MFVKLEGTSEGATRSTALALEGDAVVWKNVVNATASGSTLTKTGGAPQVEDAGGTSQQAIVSGSGTFSFTVTETSAFRFAGLTHAAGEVGASAINFAFRIQSGTADIYENNTYVADGTVAVGDTLSVSVGNGVVTYAKNGVTLYTSTHTATYPLVADASFIDPNAEIANAQIDGATGDNVDWQSITNATATGSTLVKTGGQSQVEDSGGTSVEQIASGDGFLEFTLAEASTFRFLGFAHSFTWVGGASLDYSWRVQGGYAAVYEKGVYKNEVTAVAGDILDIQVSGGAVSYTHNGTSVYTSAVPVTYPLVADASLIDANAGVAYVVLGSGSAGGTDAGGPVDAGGAGTVATRIAVPAYYELSRAPAGGGTPYWNQILSTTGTHQPVAFIVPDCSFSTLTDTGKDDATTAFNQAHANGQKVLGYVDTRFGTAPTGSGADYHCNPLPDGSDPSSDPMALVADWYNTYGSSIDGIMFDDGPTYDTGEMPAGSTETSYQTYYNHLYSLVRNLHPDAVILQNASLYPYSWLVDSSAYTIASPQNGPNGTPAVADYVITFEGSMAAYLTNYGAEWPAGGSSGAPSWWSTLSAKTMHVVFNVQTTTDLATVEARAAQTNPGLVFFMDCLSGNSSCPQYGGYDHLPAYWATEAANYAQ